MKSAAEIFRENLGKLIERAGGNANAAAQKWGMTQSTVHRLHKGERTPKPEVLDQIAKANHLEAWHLFVTDLDPDRKPLLEREAGQLRDTLNALLAKLGGPK